jgi:hypothetical protein
LTSVLLLMAELEGRAGSFEDVSSYAGKKRKC